LISGIQVKGKVDRVGLQQVVVAAGVEQVSLCKLAADINLDVSGVRPIEVKMEIGCQSKGVRTTKWSTEQKTNNNNFFYIQV